MPNHDSPISVADAIAALAFIGDLSMGQPTDHSPRTAWLGARIAALGGHDDAMCRAVRQVALLRWSGCTANAPEFADLLGDDVGGRATLLEQRIDDPAFAYVAAKVHANMRALTSIHCEVSGQIAGTLGVANGVEQALRHIFARYDEHGADAAQVPASVFIVALAGDLEILSRAQGLAGALATIARKAGVAYPRALADGVARHAADWLARLDRDETWRDEVPADSGSRRRGVALELVADVVDLKLPWLAGHSRRVAAAARDCAAAMGLDAASRLRCYRAALLHGVGRAAIPNGVWNAPGPLTASAREQTRLAPYWTGRAAGRIGRLAGDAEIASYVGERLDGSGHFRNCLGAAIPLEGRIVACAAAWIALRSARPWRPAFALEQARAQLQGEARAGRFDAGVADALCGAGALSAAPAPAPAAPVALTGREIDILRAVSLGHTNKEVARQLDISPSTVRTHLENVFRKLACTTRAAATLKALTWGLI